MIIDHSLIMLGIKLNGNVSVQLPIFQQDQTNNTSYTADLDEVIAWLKLDIICHDKQQHVLLEQLRAGLLKSLREHVLKQYPQAVITASNQDDEDNASSVNELMFGLLLFSGTVLAVCEGYDYVTSILSCLTWIPSPIVCVVGLVFAMLSIMLFYGFDLEEISKNLNVKIITPLHLLDIYLQQVNEMDAIKQWLQSQIHDVKNSEDLERLYATLAMLRAYHDRLNAARDKFDKLLHDPFLIFLKSATAILAAVISFGSGYLASQSLSLTIVGLFLTSVSVTSLPVLAICSAIGLAAVGVYWHVERPGIENLIGKLLMGLDSERVNKFKQDISFTLELGHLEKCLNTKSDSGALQDQIASLREQNEKLQEQLRKGPSTPDFFSSNRSSPIGVCPAISPLGRQRASSDSKCAFFLSGNHPFFSGHAESSSPVSNYSFTPVPSS